MVKAHNTRPQRKPKTAGLKESSVPKTRGCGNIGKTRGRSSDFRLPALARRLPIPCGNSDLLPALYPVTAAGPCRSFTGFPACAHGTHLVQGVSIDCPFVLSSRMNRAAGHDLTELERDARNRYYAPHRLLAEPVLTKPLRRKTKHSFPTYFICKRQRDCFCRLFGSK